jgi:pimeloyl-ACP methyl ester carboxylesterase
MYSLGIAGVLTLTQGCAIKEMTGQPRVAMPVPANYEIHRKPRAQLEEIARETIDEGRRYRHELLSFRIQDIFETQTNVVEQYLPKRRTGKKPLIVELPILGGDEYRLEQHFARAFANKGYAVLFPHRPYVKDEIKQLEDVDGFLRESVLDAQRIIDWAQRQEGIDEKNVGIFGASFGALRGVLATALEPRVKAAVLGLGGADLAYIFMHTSDEGLTKHRERALEKYGLTAEKAESTLRGLLTYDPMRLAESVDTTKVFLVQATHDKVVPAQTGDLLWELLGRPKRMNIWAGHLSALVYIPCIKAEAVKFFDEKLREKKNEKRH